MRGKARLCSIPLALLLSAAAPAAAVAGSTDPVLVIGQASVTPGSSPRILDLLGSWGFDDALQVDYPLRIVVSQGSSYVRYRFGQAPVAGTFSGLADGLAAGELASFEATGSPVADAAIARLALHEMTLSLPPMFSPGTLSVILYVSLPGEGTFFSNTAAAQGEGS